jgi:hypothetical protein
VKLASRHNSLFFNVLAREERELRPIDSVAATVTSLRINEPIAEKEFDIEIPDGTWVNDTVAKETYLLREKGNKRPILKDEYDGTNYQQLLTTEPRNTDDKSARLGVIVGTMLGALALVAILLFYRRSRKFK